MRFFKRPSTAWFLLIIFILSNIAPVKLFSLTSGPSQPEFQNFTPVGTSELVDLSSGAFNYNIPLMDIDGYPINISYNSSITMEQEASCVGLGWTINVGSINRNLRGLPDDFKGPDRSVNQDIQAIQPGEFSDVISRDFFMATNSTVGGKVGGNFELFGKGIGASFSLGASYNNYKGLGFDIGLGTSLLVGNKSGKSAFNIDLGLNANSSGGISFEPNINFSGLDEDGKTGGGKYKIGLGLKINSTYGLQQMNFNVGAKTAKEASNISNVASSSFSFNDPSYIPKIQFPYTSASGSLTFKAGPDFIGGHVNLFLSGYFASQQYDTRNLSRFGYGHLYAHQAKYNNAAMLDFNRDQDAPYTKNKPNLAFPFATDDVFSVCGQGVSGSYQIKRSDVGVYFDPFVASNGGGGNLSLEVGAGNAFKIGLDVIGNAEYSNAGGKWLAYNPGQNQLDFQALPGNANPKYEAAFFKVAGEKSVETDPDFMNKIGNEVPLKPNIVGKGSLAYTTNKLILKSDATLTPINNGSAIVRTQRERRSDFISYLSGTEATRAGFEKTIESYNTFGNFVGTPIPRVDADGSKRKAHHISEIFVLNKSGQKYIYGIPAYNNTSEEYGFAAGINVNPSCANGQIPYTPSAHLKPLNAQGRDQYYSKQVTPAYAHTYLLTNVLSPDYQDVKQDGCSYDDMGSFTKIRYTRTSPAYNWRAPYDITAAIGNEGLKSVADDTKGSFVYGTKEMWYVHSVEGKNHYAVFHYTARLDGIAVAGRDGGIKSLPGSFDQLFKLESITQYAKKGLTPNPSQDYLIKSANFVYDYTLCGAVPNNSGTSQIVDGVNINLQKGKLTLKKIYFKYETSFMGVLSPYIFSYVASGSHDNPAYAPGSFDRWGYFKPNVYAQGNTACDGLTNAASNFPTNMEKPYVIQDPALQNQYAAAWTLKQITLPTGGIIKVNYESNDYAFVQNKRAMQMFDIISVENSSGGFNPATPTVTRNKLYEGSINNNYLVFKFKKTIAGSMTTIKDSIRSQYIGDIEDAGPTQEGKLLYFKCLTRINNVGNANGNYEYVPGYARIKSFGAISSTYGYIELMQVKIADNEFKEDSGPKGINQIAKTGMQFARINLSDRVFGLPPDQMKNQSGWQNIKSAVSALANLSVQMVNWVTGAGLNETLKSWNTASEIELTNGKSFIRLYTPDMKKLGGGSRVKSINISDNWAVADPTAAASYEQEYDYTKIEMLDGHPRRISSGVGSYEPMIGGEENPFKLPLYVSMDKVWAADERYLSELPYGESLFPSAQIVYSRVTVRNKKYANVNLHAPGYTVSEFYTARDFPTIVDFTVPTPIRYKPNPILQLFKVACTESMTVGQGFSIELNDMHGKPKSNFIYDENNSKISGVEYIYKTDPLNKNKLSNLASVISTDGTVLHNQKIGMDISMIADSRQMYSEATSMGLQFQGDLSFIGFFPLFIFTMFGNLSADKTQFRSLVYSKVVNRYGLLDVIKVYQGGSFLQTQNIAYDAETGDVIVSKTQNENEDYINSIDYPAHWAYKTMGGAYRNTGLTVTGCSYNFSSGTLTFPSGLFASNTLYEGDELLITSGISKVAKAWVYTISGNTAVLLNKNGAFPASTEISASGNTIKVITSGSKNLLTTRMGTVKSLDKIVDPALSILQFNKLLSSSATTYRDRWQHYSYCLRKKEKNPYLHNYFNSWRPLKSYVLYADRTYTNTPVGGTKTNAFVDGIIAGSNNNFWSYSSGWNASSDAKWIVANENTVIDPNSNILESRDAIPVYSAALYGYKNQLVTAITKNSKFTESVFDSFEDYDNQVVSDSLCNMYDDLTALNHILINSQNNTMITSKISGDCAHTGSFSLKNDQPNAQTFKTILMDAPLVFDITAEYIDERYKVQRFTPERNKKYIISAWVREVKDASLKVDPNKTSFTSSILVEGNNTVAFSIKYIPAGRIIDGWQRIYGVLDLGPTFFASGGLTLKFMNYGNGVYAAYFDDVRITPYNASMVSYVYDWVTRRLVAQLDENNYPVYYEYDKEGNLDHLKKATENGIQTIKESRSAKYKIAQ